MSSRESALNYVRSHREQTLSELIDLVRIPSVSTAPEHKEDMLVTAQWLANKLNQIGMQRVQILPTPGHPVIFAEYLSASTQPTVLIYGHYDVQPTDPIDLWQSDPFTPDQRGENLYARGASDMKGQVIASIKAVEAALKAGDLPLNVKFIIEGEEEIGSPNLPAFLREHKTLLAADVALNPDTGMMGPELPTIVYALRGLAYFEIRLYGQDHDLHSGVYGGIVLNPAQALVELLAGMHDANGCVTLPGFYDKVRALSSEERAELARLNLDDAYYLKQTGARALWGEQGYSAVERVGARPTLDINGILSGFTGKGSKTVIPAWAMAKVSTRLVPDQDPRDVQGQLDQYLTKNLPDGFRYELEHLSGGHPSISDVDHPATKALAKGLESVWGTKPLYKREGGSVPVVADMQQILGFDSTLTGFGLPDDNIHAPNEKLHLPTWYRGIEALVHFIYNYGGH